MMRTLYGRIALVFAALTLICGGFTGWVYMDMTARNQQEVLQRLSKDLASHIAGHTDLVHELKWNRPAIDELFHMLMVVNPGIEVYLLRKDGGIEAHVAPQGRVKRQQVDLAPIHDFLAGKAFPIRGDDPRSETAGKIFSAAPLKQGGVIVGYLYVVLAGEAFDRLDADVWASRSFTTAIWLSGGLLLLTLVAGLAAFGLITRRLRHLTGQVAALQGGAAEGGTNMNPNINSNISADSSPDEIGGLSRAFHLMSARIDAQVGELRRQDQLRREMVANISHDLRTPLTSLQGYLETLQLKADSLPREDRERYLDVAVRHSRKVSKLAQELFELAKLECEVVQPQTEVFALAELVQDVLQKFELPAAELQVSLGAHVDVSLPPVKADIGLIERVLTNLIDNALRYTPPQGRILVEAGVDADGAVRVRVQDSGSGIPQAKRALLFERPSPISDARGRTAGGLGLLIVKRILNLHGSSIRLEDSTEPGAAFSFALPVA
jgi:signal transduction histidine kinase